MLSVVVPSCNCCIIVAILMRRKKSSMAQKQQEDEDLEEPHSLKLNKEGDTQQETHGMAPGMSTSTGFEECSEVIEFEEQQI